AHEEAKHRVTAAFVTNHEARRLTDPGAERGPRMRGRAAALAGKPGVDQSRRGDQDEPGKALRLGEHRLGGDQAAHRVADQSRPLLDPELLAELDQEAAVAGHVDRPAWHRAAAEA